MANIRSKTCLDTSRTQIEMSSYRPSQQSNGKSPSYSVSSFSHHERSHYSDSDDDAIASINVNGSQDDLTEEEDLDDFISGKCAVSTRCDSAIDLSVTSLDRTSSSASRKHLPCRCICKCHMASEQFTRASFLSCPNQKPLQVSISFPVYTDGSYADPRNLAGRPPWFVDTEPPRTHHLVAASSANFNSNNNNKQDTKEITALSSHSTSVDASNQLGTDQQDLKAYSKKTNFMSKNKWLCFLIIILAIVTLITFGTLLYLGKYTLLVFLSIKTNLALNWHKL